MQDSKLFGWLSSCYAAWEHMTVGCPPLQFTDVYQAKLSLML